MMTKKIIGNLLIIVGSILLIIWVFSFYYYPYRIDGIRSVNLIWLMGLITPILFVIRGFINAIEMNKYIGLEWENPTVVTYLFRRKKASKTLR